MRSQKNGLRRAQAVQGLTEEQKASWEKAFKAVEAYMAAQNKFHTSELARYEERDKKLQAMNELWKSQEPAVDRVKGVLHAHRDSIMKERKINKKVNVNNVARGKPAKAMYKALIEAGRPPAKADRGLQAIEDTSELDAAFEEYYDTALNANKAELAFHNVEFEDFKGQQACVDQGRKDIETATSNIRFSASFKGCLFKVRKDVKQAVVNVADKNRKVARKDVRALWSKFAKLGIKFLMAHHGKGGKGPREGGQGKRGPREGGQGERGPRELKKIGIKDFAL